MEATRAAAATAYGDALKRINDLLAVYAPSAAGFEAGTRAGHDLRSLYRMRREALEQARRWVRRLPREYRLFGALELHALRRRLDELVAEPAAMPAEA